MKTKNKKQKNNNNEIVEIEIFLNLCFVIYFFDVLKEVFYAN